jgi:hypothetical protein
MTRLEINIDYSKFRKNQSKVMTDEEEEARLDQLDELFPKIMELRDQEDLLLGIPRTKYDAQKKDYYTIYPDGKIIYGKETRA